MTDDRRIVTILVLITVLLVACSPTTDGNDSGSTLTSQAELANSTLTELGDYYAGTSGLAGASLKAALHNKVKVALRLTYARVAYELQYTDADPNRPDRIITIYSGRSLPTDMGGSDPNESWNREHVWAKSHGFPRVNMPAHTDLHHIRPCEISLNRLRGDSMFAELPNREEVDTAPGIIVDSRGDKFSPPPSVRGDIARMLFYMELRYEGDDPREPDLRLVDTLPDDVKNGVDAHGSGYHSHLRTLLRWHQDDPVDNFERRRNQRIFERQKNRNPFIDHPEFAAMIYQGGSSP